MNENRATVQASDGGQVNVQLSTISLEKVSLGCGIRIRQRTVTTNRYSLLRLQTLTPT